MTGLDSAHRDGVAVAPDEHVLRCVNVTVAYESSVVLDHVSVTVGEGEIVAVLGTNGAGKSTLLKVISGLVEPVGGDIILDGRRMNGLGGTAIAHLGVVHVPAGRSIFPTLSVADHFRMGAWLTRRDAQREAERTDELLEQFPVLRKHWSAPAGNLSGGEQHQIALLMALVGRPRLVMIDELALGLAPTVVTSLLEVVEGIRASGCPVLLVEQSVRVAAEVATRAYFLEGGTVRFEGPIADLHSDGAARRALFVPDSPAVDAALARRPEPETRRAAPGGMALEVRGLTKAFGGVDVISDVSFTIEQGTTLGVIGPNGAGKTTLVDLVSGTVRPDQGAVVLHGVDVTRWAADRRARVGLGRSFQDARLFPALTVAETVAVALERHHGVRDHLAALLNLPHMRRSEVDVAWRVDDLLELLGLSARRDTFIFELSTGTRRVVDLATAIAHNADVLVLDEPSSGLAQQEREALHSLLRTIQEATGAAMLVVEHDLALISAVADEVLCLVDGKVIARGRPAEVLADPEVAASYLGSATPPRRRRRRQSAIHRL